MESSYSTSNESGTQANAACIGILAADPLRSIGLKSILEDSLKVRAIILSDETRTRNCKPNLLIVDESLDRRPGLGGPISRMLVHMPGVAIIVLTRGDSSDGGHGALAAGARGVLPETAEIPEIRACIKAVLKGKTWLPRDSGMGPEHLHERQERAPGLAYRFTPKEREVMHWLTQGRSNREIASTMQIDEATVKAHLGRMLRKANATNRVELTLRTLAEVRTAKPSPVQITSVQPK